MGFLRVGVWEVPMWGQCGSLCGDTPLLTFLPMKAGEGLGDLLLLVSCCSVGVCGREQIGQDCVFRLSRPTFCK